MITRTDLPLEVNPACSRCHSTVLEPAAFTITRQRPSKKGRAKGTLESEREKKVPRVSVAPREETTTNVPCPALSREPLPAH